MKIIERIARITGAIGSVAPASFSKTLRDKKPEIVSEDGPVEEECLDVEPMTLETEAMPSHMHTLPSHNHVINPQEYIADWVQSINDVPQESIVADLMPTLSSNAAQITYDYSGEFTVDASSVSWNSEPIYSFNSITPIAYAKYPVYESPAKTFDVIWGDDGTIKVIDSDSVENLAQEEESNDLGQYIQDIQDLSEIGLNSVDVGAFEPEQYTITTETTQNPPVFAVKHVVVAKPYNSSSVFALPVGSITTVSGALPLGERLLPCEGQTLAKADYLELYQAWKKIGQPIAWGETSEHFNLPDLRTKSESHTHTFTTLT